MSSVALREFVKAEKISSSQLRRGDLKWTSIFLTESSVRLTEWAFTVPGSKGLTVRCYWLHDGNCRIQKDRKSQDISTSATCDFDFDF